MFDYSLNNDEELLRQLRLPKPDSDIAFMDIYLKYSNKLNSYCMLKLFDREITKDIIQEIWLEFVKAVKNGINIHDIKSYLINIAHNIIYNYQIQNQKKSQMFVNEDGIYFDGISFNYNLQESLENADFLAIVKLCASNLEEPCREIYLLKKFNDLTFVEIANITGDSIQSIKRNFSKASIMMHKLLKPYFDEMKNERI